MQGVTTPGKGEHGIDDFMKKAITLDGPEMQALGDKAREYNLYIAGGGVIEQVPEFPDRWFNTAFIIGPTGEVVLRYHKWHVPASIGLGSCQKHCLRKALELGLGRYMQAWKQIQI